MLQFLNLHDLKGSPGQCGMLPGRFRAEGIRPLQGTHLAELSGVKKEQTFQVFFFLITPVGAFFMTPAGVKYKGEP